MNMSPITDFCRTLQVDASAAGGIDVLLSPPPLEQRDDPSMRVHGVAEGDLIQLQGSSSLWLIRHLWHDGKAWVECLERAWVETRLVRLLAVEPRCRGDQEAEPDC